MCKVNYNARPVADAIIVLGAAVWAGGPSPTLQRRARHAAALFHAGHAPLIVATGGLGLHPPTEAMAITEILISQNVPAKAIIQEGKSTTTLENLGFSRKLLGPETRTVIIVTDRTHAPRARLTARHLGFNATTMSPSLRGGHPRTILRQTIRELFAYPAYALRLWIRGRNADI
ncbi:YdcF family protein [Loktanella sp. 3ANDIMAR09]|uniref:YdcF family protein n=1 Tax=Loktanella sp. 3ANDIMAR09 TaxID=1225657 RepID=UPI00209D815F|nr:YdcF family protein [Loktanella sp. 3ANDIMAR09]